MQCPNCQREQPPARYCVACGVRMSAATAAPDPLDQVEEAPGIPRDAGSSGTFAFGRDTPIQATLKPSDWAAPMRLVVTGWLAFSALIDVYVVFQLQDAIRQAAFPTAGVNSGAVSASDGLASARLAFNVVLGLLVAWLVVKAFLALGAYAGRSAWVFYACLALAGLNGLLGLVSLVMIVIDLGHGSDPIVPVVSLLVQATGAGLFAWMVAALRRYGPWAVVLVPPESA